MSFTGWLQFAVLLVTAPLLSRYMAKVYSGGTNGEVMAAFIRGLARRRARTLARPAGAPGGRPGAR